MYGSPASSRRASAAEIFAICISESAPSIMRAPPEQEMMIERHCARQRALDARVIFSPTTTPMLPPMKPYSMAAMTTGCPRACPCTR